MQQQVLAGLLGFVKRSVGKGPVDATCFFHVRGRGVPYHLGHFGDTITMGQTVLCGRQQRS
jgi:hypothetical protein